VLLSGVYLLKKPGAENKIAKVVASPNSVITTIKVEAGSFYFSPSEIRVKKGDKVKIILTNKDGFHDWVVDEFNARTPQIKAGETVEIEFIADKTGTFEYYCSVGNNRQMGMKGNLIVE
jgi:cytochrome c oxidase subunit 2